MHLMDPMTLQQTDVSAPVYWRQPFESLATVSDLVEFVVLDIEPSGQVRGRHVLADAQVVRASSSSANRMDEDGMGDDGIFHTRTHLGAILQPGDTVLGYHLTNANFNNSEFESLNQDRIPDVILVKKTYPNRRRKSRPRNWKLRSIAKEAEDATEGSNVVGRGALGRRGGVDQKNVERDYELFLRDLEEDKEMRAAINLYKSDKTAGPSGGDVDMSGHTAGSGMKGGKKRSGKKAQAQAAMDVEQDVQPTTSAPVARAQGGFRSTGDDMDEDGMDEDGDVDSEDDDADGEEEEDFPEIELDELLEHFEEMDVQDELEGGSEVQ